MKIKNVLKKSNTGFLVAIIIGIIAMVNFFAYQIFFRIDLTENKDYSISKISKKTVGGLDDLVNIKLYFSDNLPSRYITLRQEVGDILDEYKNYSNGNVRVEFVDIKDDTDTERELYMLGIPQLQFNVLEKDKYQVVTGYLGMAVQYGDSKEVIPVVENTKNLEYQVTMAIKKVTGQVKGVVGFVTGNGSLDLENEISSAVKKIKELYSVVEVDLNEGVSENINTLIIVGAKEKFSDEQIKKLDAFAARGGSLLIAVDGVTVSDGLATSPNDLGLSDFLKGYGVKLNNNLVLDPVSGMASFTQGFMSFSTNYPFWPMITKEGFDQDNSVVSALEGLVLAWASSIDVEAGENKVSYLAKTSGRAWKESDNFNLNPQQMFVPAGKQEKMSLAVAVSGNYQSTYNTESAGESRLVLVGDSDFVNDNFVRMYPDNVIFFQNLVDSLSMEEDLINIRSKGVSERPIKELSDSAKAAIRYANIFGVTILVISFGMIRYYLRKRSKFVDEL